jgi:hypothetical protein
MNKMFFLALILLLWSAASMNAQVLIGGDANATPAVSSILDLDAGGANSNKGLFLPLVVINSTTDTATMAAPPQDGLLVCNTTGTLAHGVYYWSGGATGSWILYIKF